MTKLLLVDDSIEYCIFMKEFLETHGFTVYTATSAIEGLHIFKEKIIDLVITDLQMEEVDGVQLMSLLREMHADAKVIILTSSESEEDELKGLDLKADEYLKKNTPLRVLLARIKRVLREETSKVRDFTSLDEELTVKVQQRKVFKSGEEVILTKKEYDLLVYFLKNRKRVLSREMILRDVWNEDIQFVDARVIDTHVKNLRAKLRLTCIYSVRGVGYEWIE